MSNPFLASGSTASNIEPVPAGLQAAILTGLYDLGWQYNEKFDKNSKKVVFRFEFPLLPHLKGKTKEGVEFDLPRVLNKQLTNSLHEKAVMRLMIQSWIGRPLTAAEVKDGLDLTKLLNRSCTVQVMHTQKPDGSIRADFTTVIPYQGQKLTTATKPLLFSVSQLKTAAELDTLGLPEWIVKIVKEGDAYKKLAGKASAAPAPASTDTSGPSGEASPFDPAPPEDDVPF